MPWFTVVIGFFTLVWAFYKWIPKITDATIDSNERKSNQLTFHFLVLAIVNSVVFFYCTFAPFKNNPWYIFVLIGSALSLAAHYTICFIDLRKDWILPQLYVYLVASAVTFCIWFFYDRRAKNWFIWPISIWGILIGIQVVVFVIRVRQKAKKNEQIKNDIAEDSEVYIPSEDMAFSAIDTSSMAIKPIYIYQNIPYGTFRPVACLTPQDDIAISCSSFDDVNYVEYISSA